MTTFTNAYCTGSFTDRKSTSTSSYCTNVYCTYVWEVKKQGMVTIIGIKVEFTAMAKGICEGTVIEFSLKLYCDTKAAMSIAYVHIQHNWLSFHQRKDKL